MKYKKVNLIYPKKLFKKKEVLSEKNGFNYPKKWTLKENKRDFKLISNKKLFLFIFSLIFLIGLINFTSAETSLGTFKQGENVRVSQVCSDATYINLSSITYPTSNTAVSNIQMNPVGSGEYFYDFNNTQILGRYDVRGISDGCDKTFATYFNITPSGNSGTDNLVFVIFVIVLAYTITGIGFFSKNTWVAILGGGMMIFLAAYFNTNGVIIFRDDLTMYLIIITWGLGALVSTIAAVEYIQESFG